MLTFLMLGTLIVVGAAQERTGWQQGGDRDNHNGGHNFDFGHNYDWISPGHITSYRWYSYPYTTHYTYPYNYYWNYPYYGYPSNYWYYNW
jgi:hypothetical protein